jgi:hypothetical protein
VGGRRGRPDDRPVTYRWTTRREPRLHAPQSLTVQRHGVEAPAPVAAPVVAIPGDVEHAVCDGERFGEGPIDVDARSNAAGGGVAADHAPVDGEVDRPAGDGHVACPEGRVRRTRPREAAVGRVERVDSVVLGLDEDVAIVDGRRAVWWTRQVEPKAFAASAAETP